MSVQKYIVWHKPTVNRQMREACNKHPSFILWLQAYQAQVNQPWLITSNKRFMKEVAVHLCLMEITFVMVCAQTLASQL